MPRGCTSGRSSIPRIPSLLPCPSPLHGESLSTGMGELRWRDWAVSRKPPMASRSRYKCIHCSEVHSCDPRNEPQPISTRHSIPPRIKPDLLQRNAHPLEEVSRGGGQFPPSVPWAAHDAGKAPSIRPSCGSWRLAETCRQRDFIMRVTTAIARTVYTTPKALKAAVFTSP